jgi:hypothetical protein
MTRSAMMRVMNGTIAGLGMDYPRERYQAQSRGSRVVAYHTDRGRSMGRFRLSSYRGNGGDVPEVKKKKKWAPRRSQAQVGVACLTGDYGGQDVRCRGTGIDYEGSKTDPERQVLGVEVSRLFQVSFKRKPVFGLCPPYSLPLPTDSFNTMITQALEIG